MARFTETIETDLPAATVFAYLAHFEHTADWDPGIASAARLDDGEVSVGSRFRVEANVGPAMRTLVYHVTDHRPDEHVRFETTSTLMEGSDDVTIRAVGDGRSQVVWDARFGFRGPAGRLIDPLFQPVFNGIAERAVAGLRDELRELASTQAA